MSEWTYEEALDFVKKASDYTTDSGELLFEIASRSDADGMGTEAEMVMAGVVAESTTFVLRLALKDAPLPPGVADIVMTMMRAQLIKTASIILSSSRAFRDVTLVVDGGPESDDEFDGDFLKHLREAEDSEGTSGPPTTDFE